jgi:cobalt/nickel transport system ATP-binding protein
MDKNGVIIRLANISYGYPGRSPVLDGLDLSFRRGDHLGLIGSNGSGKTTLFHVIMGLLKPSSGSIEILGKVVSEEKDFRQVRTKVGLLFQDADDQLFSPTVLEDVAFGPLNQGKSRQEAKQIAEETLRSLGLAGFESRITHKLSGGEKRLVSLAAVLAMKPEVLLLDEPTTGLDDATERRLVDVLRNLDVSYLLVSHDIDFLMETTDRISCMVGGKISLDDESIPHTHIHLHKHGKHAHKHGLE